MPLPALQGHAHELGVADVQLRLTPLEEVFLNVSRKAELEHAQVCNVCSGLNAACVLKLSRCLRDTP